MQVLLTNPFSFPSLIFSALLSCRWSLSALISMVLSLTLFCLLLSTLVSGHLLTDDLTTRRPKKRDPEERRKMQARIQSRKQRSVGSQDDNECQEGNPLGASYSGRMNVTVSGRTCQIWAAQQSHEHEYTHVGEHNHCRNPDGDLGDVISDVSQ